MSNFKCEKCGTDIIDSPTGYVTRCGHYPKERAAREMEQRKRETEMLVNIQNIFANYIDIANPHLPLTLARYFEYLTAGLTAQLKAAKEARDVIFRGILTEIGAGMVMFVKSEEDRVWNQACERAKQIVTNYQKGDGIFQLAAIEPEKEKA